MPTINIKQENVTYIAMWLLLFSTPTHRGDIGNIFRGISCSQLSIGTNATIQAADRALCMFYFDIGGGIYSIAKLDKTNNAWTKTAQTKS